MPFIFLSPVLSSTATLIVGQAIEWQQKKCESDSLKRTLSKGLRWDNKDRLCEMVFEINNLNSTSAASGASLR